MYDARHFLVADLCLAENLEKFVVRQKIEAAEAGSFGLQVVAQALLDHVQQLGALTELVQQLRVIAELDAPDVGLIRRRIGLILSRGAP